MSATTPCPRCGSPLTEIAYGMPGHELFEAAERGEVVLGGCVVSSDSPTHSCLACGAAAHVDDDDGTATDLGWTAEHLGWSPRDDR